MGLGIRRAARVALLTLVFAGEPAAQSGVAHVQRDAVNAALAKGGVLVERPQVRVAAGHRDKPGAVERQNGTSIFYIHDGDAVFASDGRTQRLAKGDVLVVPAGTMQSFVSVATPISYLQIVVPVLAKDAKAEQVYVAAEKVSATLKKAGPLADAPNLRVSGGFRPSAQRDASPVAEIHANEADLFFVISGSATQMLGGRMMDGRQTGPGQIRGPRTEAGQTYQLGKGDVMWVPAGTPHWFPEIAEPLSYLLVKVFY